MYAPAIYISTTKPASGQAPLRAPFHDVQLPAGWWLLPSIVGGTAIWVQFFIWIL